MHVGFLIIGIISSFIWTYKCTGAVPTVTLNTSSSPYFDNGGSLSLTCAINQDVGINTVYLVKNGYMYILVQINSPSSCVFYNYTNPDPHSYNITCQDRMTVYIVMSGINSPDDNAVWTCQMSAQSGICSTPCKSILSVSTVQRVPVSSVQLTDGTGQPLDILDGSKKDFQCHTFPNGSRPRAFFNWYKRSEYQSPILIQNQSVSIPSPKQEVDFSINISNSTLTLMVNRSYQNMYIYCEARDETNRGNYSRSREVQLNIVYPPVVQLFPSASVFNVTEGSPKFVFTCNVTDANPMPQPDGYSWLLGGIVIQGQTRSSYELLNVQKSQDGVYQCMARNGYGTGNSSTVDFNVQYGPRIFLIDYTEVEEGENVSITCNVTANPQPNIVWTRNGTVILPASDTLRIPNISRLNEGNYTCTASNVLYPTGQSSVSQMAMDTLRIRVLYGPGSSIYLIPNMSLYQVEESQKAADIVCIATCNPACSYRWMKGNIPINSSSTLSLGIVQKNETGNYVCEAFNTIRGQRRGFNISIIVVVRYAPVVKLQAAVRDVNPYRVKEDRENVVLVCEVVDAYPQPTLFVWTHNGNEIQSESSSNFTIPVATRQINGTWGCKGLNSYGTPLESQLQVDVQYGPVIVPIGNRTIIEGKMLSVTCNVDSNPWPAFVSWTKDNNATFSHNTAVLTISNVSRYDSGTFRCRAVNIIHPSGQNEESLNGTEWFYLNVQYGAQILNLSVPEGNTVNENTTATLRCLVDSNPKSDITWTRQGILETLQTNYFVHESQLIIEHAGCLDTSNYTCNANNGVRHPVERNVPLFVTCHPRTDFRSPPVTKVYSKRYGYANMSYTVISFPEPTFSWIFIGKQSENRLLPDSATQYDNGLQSVLMFKSLSINDFGFYKVVAKNIFPTSAIEVYQLIPADVPDIPSNVTVTDVKQTSLTVRWVAGYNGGLEQTFHIMITAGDITRSVYAPDPGYGKLGTQTIEDLIPNTEYNISMSANNSLGSSSVTNVIIQTTLKEDTVGIPVAAIAGGVSAGFVVIVVMGIGIFLWRRSQHEKQNKDNNDVMRNREERHDAASGQEFDGLHLTGAEASSYLQLNDMRLEENRKASTRSPEIDSYEKLHTYANNDIQMYSSLKIPKTSKDSEIMYENMRRKQLT